MTENKELLTKRIRLLNIDFEFHAVVFPVSALLILAFVSLTALWPGWALIVFNSVHNWIVQNFAWLYIPSLTTFLLVAFYLVASEYGTIRLGPNESRPEFSRISWFAMLFSAGMGIGMIFFGVVEPMTHYLHPPTGEAESLNAARQSMAITLFHWGFHPWGLYGLVALSLGYFGFRRGLPLSFRSIFYPILGRHIYYKIGDIIDIMAVIATLFGLATSLGLGAQQINAGLAYVFGWPPQSVTAQIMLIMGITLVAMISLISGIHVGIKWLSNLNLLLAALLLFYLFVMGPTVYLLGTTVENFGAYVSDIVFRSFWTASYTSEGKSNWFSSWTVFYWGWWLSWSPYVGGFIARISKGRTIREFIIGVLFVPLAVTLLWMTALGNSSLYQAIYHEVNPQQKAQTAYYDLTPKRYDVQTVSARSGLPLSKNGQWWVASVGPGDTKVKIKPNKISTTIKGRTVFTAADDQPVTHWHGVLVNAQTFRPYWPGSDTRFTGQFKSKTRSLGLAGFIDSPVLNVTKDQVMDSSAMSLFVMLSAYPLSSALSFLAIVSIALFFITSSDSASLLADIIASGGTANPTTGTRVFWALLQGILASTLLVAGGTVALQTGAITLGLPLCFGFLLVCFTLLKGLRLERKGQIPYEHKRHIASKA